MKNSQPEEISLIESAMQRIAGEKKNANTDTTQLDPHILVQVAPVRPLDHPFTQALAGPANEPTLAPASRQADAFATPGYAPQTIIQRKFSTQQMLFAVAVAGLTGAILSWSLKPASTNPTPALATAVPQAPAPTANAATTRTAVAKDPQTQAGAQLERWRLAWQNKDIESYLQSYSKEFVPPNGQLRSDWEALRRKNLAKRSAIQVGISAIRMENISADRIKIFFLQDYASGTYREHARAKEMLMLRTDSRWEIAEERQYPQASLTARRK